MTYLTNNLTYLTKDLISITSILLSALPSKLSDDFKAMVIQGWLAGEQRDKIAVDNGLSAGAVTNIVNEWRQALGFHLADALRIGCCLEEGWYNSCSMCSWFRMLMMLNRLGVRKITLSRLCQMFIIDVANLTRDSERIAFYITNLLEFSQMFRFRKYLSI